MSKELTKTQFETLKVIAVFIQDHRFCPTFAELASIFGISINGIQTRLKQMRRKGVIDWRDGQSRTMHLTDAGHVALHQNEEILG